MAILWSKTNVKNSVNAGERKASRGLADNFYGHIRVDGNVRTKTINNNTMVGKTEQDYGNSKTQVIRSS